MAALSLKRIDPAGTPPVRSPIDLEHLGRQTLGDEGLALEVLRMFDDMSRLYYERLETSTSVPELLRNLHTLKGAAAGIGAFGLAELARIAETELRNGTAVNPERIDDLNVATEGYLTNAPDADHATWEPPAVAAEGIVWQLRQPWPYTGWRESMRALREREGIMASEARRHHPLGPILDQLVNGPYDRPEPPRFVDG